MLFKMDNFNIPPNFFTLIENVGYIRSIYDSDSFHCFFDQCTFESIHVSDLFYHFQDHKEKWFGFCYACNAQVNNQEDESMKELQHMIEVHYVENNDNGIGNYFKFLSGNKLLKLKALTAAAGQRLNSNLAASTSKSFLYSEDEQMQFEETSSTSNDTPPINPSLEIVNWDVRSRANDDLDIISLKPWGRNPTKKTPTTAKKMLRRMCLYALFKCMDINCVFTTDITENMMNHLQNHEKNYFPPKDDKPISPNWLECPYCDIITDSCSAIVQHIQEEHKSSIFQCAYCFYRSCAAFNVIVHLKNFHQFEKKLVLICSGTKKLYETEKDFMEMSRSKNIRPIRCSDGCDKITYVVDQFVKHMKSSSVHADKFKCQFCGSYSPIEETAKHLLHHNIGVYECIYCRYGKNDMKSIQNHMCNSHPSKLAYICVRLTQKNQILCDEELRTVESTLLFQLGQTIDRTFFEICPYTVVQLSETSPSIDSKSSIPEKSSLSSMNFESDLYLDLEMKCELKLSDVLCYKNMNNEDISLDWYKYFSTMACTATSPITEIKSFETEEDIQDDGSEIQNEVEVAVGVSSPVDVSQDEIDTAAYYLVKGTGLEGSDLYRCSFPNCDEKINDFSYFFYKHLLEHHPHQSGFKCYHCKCVLEHFVKLKHHMKTHGIHRYFCYTCDFTSATRKNMKDHMIREHHQTYVKTIALNRMKNDQNTDMFVMCPEDLSEDKFYQFGCNLVDKKRRRMDSKNQTKQNEEFPLKEEKFYTKTVKTEFIDNCHIIEKTEVHLKSTQVPIPTIKISNSSDDEVKSIKRIKGHKKQVDRPKDQIHRPKKPVKRPVSKETVNQLPTSSNLSEIINFQCWHCSSKINPHTIYSHWKDKHRSLMAKYKNEKVGRPLFRIVKVFKCYYCPRYYNYTELKQHHFRNHQNETFAMVDKQKPEQCGLCSLRFDNVDIIDHFKESHNQGNVELANFLTDELLDRVVNVFSENQLECADCDVSFSSNTEFQTHKEGNHANETIMYGCSQCRERSNSEMSIVTHIRQHNLKFLCKFCEEPIDSKELIKEHHKLMHNSEDETYRNVDVTERTHLEKYLAMKIIFPNGLILTKGESKNTKYGDINSVIKHILDLNDSELAVVRKRQRENEENKSVLKRSKKSVGRGIKRRKRQKGNFSPTSSSVSDVRNDESSSSKKDEINNIFTASSTSFAENMK